MDPASGSTSWASPRRTPLTTMAIGLPPPPMPACTCCAIRWAEVGGCGCEVEASLLADGVGVHSLAVIGFTTGSDVAIAAPKSAHTVALKLAADGVDQTLSLTTGNRSANDPWFLHRQGPGHPR